MPQAFELVRGPGGARSASSTRTGQRAMSTNTADLVTYALEGVVQHGTATAAYFGAPRGRQDRHRGELPGRVVLRLRPAARRVRVDRLSEGRDPAVRRRGLLRRRSAARCRREIWRRFMSAGGREAAGPRLRLPVIHRPHGRRADHVLATCRRRTYTTPATTAAYAPHHELAAAREPSTRRSPDHAGAAPPAAPAPTHRAASDAAAARAAADTAGVGLSVSTCSSRIDGFARRRDRARRLRTITAVASRGAGTAARRSAGRRLGGQRIVRAARRQAASSSSSTARERCRASPRRSLRRTSYVHVAGWFFSPDFRHGSRTGRRSASCSPRLPSASTCACSRGRARRCRSSIRIAQRCARCATSSCAARGSQMALDAKERPMHCHHEKLVIVDGERRVRRRHRPHVVRRPPAGLTATIAPRDSSAGTTRASGSRGRRRRCRRALPPALARAR